MCKTMSKKLKHMNNEEDSGEEEEETDIVDEFVPDFVLLNTKLTTKEYKQFAFHYLTNNTLQSYENQSAAEKKKSKSMFNKQRRSIQVLSVFFKDVPKKPRLLKHLREWEALMDKCISVAITGLTDFLYSKGFKSKTKKNTPISISLTSTKKVLDAAEAHRLSAQNITVEDKSCGSNNNTNVNEKDTSVEEA